MAKVIKRDGKVVEYNNSKILTAIKNAMYETAKGVDEELCVTLGLQVDEIIKSIEHDLTVEEIQDIVELELMKSDRKDVAKQYIIYRNERDRTREVRHKDDRLLTDTFISKYKHLPSPMKQLGDFVYY
jgi:ribonucleoside-diphosphate reductase alpha chain/ribonucleoside-triphosphate reductase